MTTEQKLDIIYDTLKNRNSIVLPNHLQTFIISIHWTDDVYNSFIFHYHGMTKRTEPIFYGLLSVYGIVPEKIVYS